MEGAGINFTTGALADNFSGKMKLLSVLVIVICAGLSGAIDPWVETVSSVTLQEGSRGELSCNYQWDANAVYWKKGNTSASAVYVVILDLQYNKGQRSGPGFDEGRFDMTKNYTLVITNTRLADEGRYLCEVSDHKSGVLYRNYTDVEVKASARAVGTRLLLTSEEGSTAELPCHYDHEATTIYWSKGNSSVVGERIISLHSNRSRTGPGMVSGRFNVKSNYTLVIYEVELEDEGMYFCNVLDSALEKTFASNTFFQVYSSSTIRNPEIDTTPNLAAETTSQIPPNQHGAQNVQVTTEHATSVSGTSDHPFTQTTISAESPSPNVAAIVVSVFMIILAIIAVLEAVCLYQRKQCPNKCYKSKDASRKLSESEHGDNGTSVHSVGEAEAKPLIVTHSVVSEKPLNAEERQPLLASHEESKQANDLCESDSLKEEDVYTEDRPEKHEDNVDTASSDTEVEHVEANLVPPEINDEGEQSPEEQPKDKKNTDSVSSQEDVKEESCNDINEKEPIEDEPQENVDVADVRTPGENQDESRSDEERTQASKDDPEDNEEEANYAPVQGDLQKDPERTFEDTPDHSEEEQDQSDSATVMSGQTDQTLKTIFKKYAAFGRTGKDVKDITSMNYYKMMRECGVLDSNVNNIELDIIFTKAKGDPGIRVLTYDKFIKSLEMIAQLKYGSDDAEHIAEVKALLCSSSGPSIAGTTGISKKGKVDYFTDTSKYTGTHKERFDEHGKGKGKAGREDVY